MHPSPSPRLRSFLFVPADNDRLFESALTKQPDAIILDLEDGTHPQRKPGARAALAERLARAASQPIAMAVRINASWLEAVQDLQAAVRPGLSLLVLPKVEHPRDVQLLSRTVTELERAAGLPMGQIRFLLQIESALALSRLPEIASADPRVMAMMLGSEDFSLDIGARPTPAVLMQPSLMVLYAARSAGIQPLGWVGSIADIGDLTVFEQRLHQARELGFEGAVVVHPKCLPIIHQCFTPSAEALAKAQAQVQAFEQAYAEGKGAIQLDGEMIDKPVYWRALRVLGRDPA